VWAADHSSAAASTTRLKGARQTVALEMRTIHYGAT
jgi:hypothetical protein